MAVEEPSVVALAPHMAKLAHETGEFHARANRPVIRAQIQVKGLNDLESAKTIILEHKFELHKAVNE